jgi:hypothetical protein
MDDRQKGVMSQNESCLTKLSDLYPTGNHRVMLLRILAVIERVLIAYHMNLWMGEKKEF